MKIKNLISAILALVMGVLMMFSCKNENLSFKNFDKNKNANIEKEEFVEVFKNNYYRDWNNKNNDYLDDEDFYRSFFSVWDADKDKFLDTGEWSNAYDSYFKDYIINDFAAIDINRDDHVDYREYSNTITDSDFFKGWDTDENSYLSDEELANGVFNKWDSDQNGKLSKEEFDRFDDYYSDI